MVPERLLENEHCYFVVSYVLFEVLSLVNEAWTLMVDTTRRKAMPPAAIQMLIALPTQYPGAAPATSHAICVGLSQPLGSLSYAVRDVEFIPNHL